LKPVLGGRLAGAKVQSPRHSYGALHHKKIEKTAE
jgi:hypothetical protein